MKSGFCDFGEERFYYFDYAATTFMPDVVKEKRNYYENNIGVSAHRGNNVLSVRADNMLEECRTDIKQFFGLENYELVFYRGASHAINEIIYSIEEYLNPMDLVLLGPYEHHSNYLPWREMCKRKGIIVFEIPMLDEKTIDYEYIDTIRNRIKIVSVSSVANTNGYKINFEELKRHLLQDTLIIVDDSQKCAHETIVIDKVEADCHVVNAHKMYGPKGVAGAFFSERMFGLMKPCIFGGGMIERVGFPNVWKKGVAAFECGTIDISQVVAWREACLYIKKIGFNRIQAEEKEVYQKVYNELNDSELIRIRSTIDTYSLISFEHQKMHAHDIEQYFSDRNIIVRSGNLCSQNSIAKLGMKPITRISFGISVNDEDLEKLLEAIREIL